MIQTAPSLISIAAASREMSFSRGTVYALVKKGVIPAVRLGRSLRIRRADLDRAIERSRLMTRQEALQ